MARADGFSDDEIVEFLSEDNKKVSMAKADGFASGEILSFLMEEEPPSSPGQPVAEEAPKESALLKQGIPTQEEIDEQMKKAKFWGGASALGDVVLDPLESVPMAQPLQSVIRANEEAITNPERGAEKMQEAVDKITGIPEVLAEEEGVARTVLGLGTQIGLDESSKAGGTKLGARKGATGAAVGYISSAIIGGAASSYAAQKIEGQEEVSMGRVVRDSMINLIPFGKVTRGPKAAQKILNVGSSSPVIRQATLGGAIGSGGEVIEKEIQGEDYDAGDVALAGTMGAALGGGLGGLQKLARKYLKKTPEQIDKLIKSGDPEAVKLSNALQESLGNPPSSLTGKVDGTSELDSLVKVAKERPTQKARRLLHWIAPSWTTGEKASLAMKSATTMADAGQTRGATLAARINRQINKSPDPEASRELANDFLSGRADSLPDNLSKLSDELHSAREQIRIFQQELLDNHNSGSKLLTNSLKEQIEKSMNRGDYVSRGYRAFTEKDWTPTADGKQKAINHLMSSEGMSAKQADEYITELTARTKLGFSATQEMLTSPQPGILKAKLDVDKPIREFLGEYTDPVARAEQTINKLAQATAFDTGDINTAKALVESGMARKIGQVADEVAPEKWADIKLRRGIGMVDGEKIVGPPELQKAIDEIYGMNMDRKAQGWFSKMWEASTSFSKATKVPLNPISYAPQFWGNTINMIGMGMNPFRGAARGILASLAQFDTIAKRAPRKMMSMVDEYKKAGVLPQSLLFEDIQAGLRRGKVRRALSKYSGIDFAGKLFSIPDMAGRIVAFENYKHLYSKAVPALSDPDVPAGVKEKIREGVSRYASKHTNMTYQNYDMLSKNIRAASQKGALPQFISFHAELIRNQINQVRVIKKMATGEAARELSEEIGVEVKPSSLRVEGAKRLLLLSGIYGGLEGGRRAFNRRTMTEEQEQAWRETEAPDYDAKAPVGVKMNWETGKYEYSNASYLAPPTMISHPIMEMAKAEGMANKLQAAADYLEDNYKGEGSFTFRAVAQGLFNVDADTGKRISDEVDTLKKGEDIAQFIGTELFKPGYYREYRRYKEKGGRQAAMRLAGIRLYDGKIGEGAIYKLSEKKRGMNNTLSKIAGMRYRLEAGKISPEEFEKSYENINATYGRIQEDLIKHVNNLKTLKRTDAQIFDILKESGLGAKRSLYAYDGIILPAPKTKELSTAAKYDKALEEAGGDFGAALRATAAVNPMDAERMGEEHRKRVKYRVLKIKTKDDMIKALDVPNGDRARYIKRKMGESESPSAVVQSFLKKGLINKEVMYQLQMLEEK